MRLTRPTAAALLIVYLLILIDLTLFQYIQRDPLPNLIPFRTMIRDVHGVGGEFLFNFVGNLVAFVPFGALLPFIRPGRMNARRVLVFAAALSASIEIAQYVSGRRVADVDDVILNSAGAMLGYGALVATRGRGGPTAKDERHTYKE